MTFELSLGGHVSKMAKKEMEYSLQWKESISLLEQESHMAKVHRGHF